jgi:hypothetical protein
VRGFGHQRLRLEVFFERNQQRFRARDRAEERKHEIGQDVAVAIERRNHQRVAGRGDQQRERCVDELRLVLHIGMPFRGHVHLLLEHPFVRRAHRVLGSAEHLRAHLFGKTERELRDRTADAPFDALRAESDFVVPVAFAPLLRAVGISDRHAHYRDRRVHAAERHHARDATPGPHDDLPADLLPQDAIRRADVVASFRGDRGGLEAEALLSDRLGSLVDDPVVRRSPRAQREVKTGELELEAGHLRGEDAEGFLQEFLARVIALEHNDRFGVHGFGH